MHLREKLFLISATVIVLVLFLTVVNSTSLRSLPLSKKTLKNVVKFSVAEYAQTPTPKLSEKSVPFLLEGKAGDVGTELTLTDGGDLVYRANGKEVWKMSSARQLLVAPETDILRTVQLEGNWPVVATSGQYALHVAPFFISRSQKPHWTLFGGLETMSTATGGEVFLMSKNRLQRAALMDNGDIVVLTTKATGSSLTTTLTSSLNKSWLSA